MQRYRLVRAYAVRKLQIEVVGQRDLALFVRGGEMFDPDVCGVGADVSFQRKGMICAAASVADLNEQPIADDAWRSLWSAAGMVDNELIRSPEVRLHGILFAPQREQRRADDEPQSRKPNLLSAFKDGAVCASTGEMVAVFTDKIHENRYQRLGSKKR